jgi:hypothetical protein
MSRMNGNSRCYFLCVIFSDLMEFNRIFFLFLHFGILRTRAPALLERAMFGRNMSKLEVCSIVGPYYLGLVQIQPK